MACGAGRTLSTGRSAVGAMNLLIRQAQVEGRVVDVRVSGDRIRVVDDHIKPECGEDVLEANGGALLPGLHDHHIHLRALAASTSSIFVGPSEVAGFRELASRLQTGHRDTPRGQWIRAYGYHEAAAGPLDRHVLDAIVDTRPVRVQHRTGAAWILNSEALRTLRVDEWDETGVDRDSNGEPTGMLFRLDHRIAADPRASAMTPDIAGIGRTAAAKGVTGFTDADPLRSPGDLGAIADAQASGAFPQRVHAMGPEELKWQDHPKLTIGPVKIVLDDLSLPTVEAFAHRIRVAHREHRAVAIHCVTRLQLVVSIAALKLSGAEMGDRIEHASIVPEELIDELVRLRLTVVTQPGFVAQRGDQYLNEVDSREIPNLYRCRSLRHAGVALAFGTDAPFGPADPWVVVRAAVDRATASGEIVGADERIDAIAALGHFLGSATSPGTPRQVRADADADLCLLRVPIKDAVGNLSAELVTATVVAGQLVYHAP
jgi:predicted amidohydrolase YtcJ